MEDVESVENKITPSHPIEKKERSGPVNPSTDARANDVEDVTKNYLSSYFSTLSTEMKRSSVENLNSATIFNPNDLEDIPRIPRSPRGELSDQQGVSDKDVALILKWLQIAVDEGHIEPSQSAVGRLKGWPRREWLRKSLFIDFELWCVRCGCRAWHIPRRADFYYIVDQVFDRKDHQYFFPSLHVCRDRFYKLKKKYEHS